MKTITLGVLFIATVCVPVYAQDATKPVSTPGPVYLAEILRTFRFPSDPKVTNEEINKRLGAIIRFRRVGFLLDKKNTKELQDAGANEDLLRTIDTFLIPAEKTGVIDDAATIERKKKRLRDLFSMEDQIRDLFPKKDIETRKKLINIGKEFLNRFGADEDAKDMADYLRAVLPEWENMVKLRQEVD